MKVVTSLGVIGGRPLRHPRQAGLNGEVRRVLVRELGVQAVARHPSWFCASVST
jgi:hypothetical protein